MKMVKDTFEEYLWESRIDLICAEIDEIIDKLEEKHEDEAHGDFYVTDIHITKEAPHPHPITNSMIPEHYNITVEYEYERPEEIKGERNDWNG